MVPPRGRARRDAPHAHGRGEARAAAPPHRGGWARALPRPRVPGLQAVLDRGHGHARADARRGHRGRGRGGRARGGDGDGAPRAHQRARARARTSPVDDDLRRVRGEARRERGERHRRREVPPGLRDERATRDGGKRVHVSLDAEPEPPRDGESRARGRGARAAAHARLARPSATRRACCRICVHGDAAFPGEGVVAETFNLSQPARIPHGRHAAHHRQQPDRLHHRSARRALHALRERPREGIRGARSCT